jgi:hypothetical protein
MTVYIFVKQIAKRLWTAGIAGLRAKSPKPHIVTCLNLYPVLV